MSESVWHNVMHKVQLSSLFMIFIASTHNIKGVVCVCGLVSADLVSMHVAFSHTKQHTGKDDKRTRYLSNFFLERFYFLYNARAFMIKIFYRPDVRRCAGQASTAREREEVLYVLNT